MHYAQRKPTKIHTFIYALLLRFTQNRNINNCVHCRSRFIEISSRKNHQGSFFSKSVDVDGCDDLQEKTQKDSISNNPIKLIDQFFKLTTLPNEHNIKTHHYKLKLRFLSLFSNFFQFGRCEISATIVQLLNRLNFTENLSASTFTLSLLELVSLDYFFINRNNLVLISDKIVAQIIDHFQHFSNIEITCENDNTNMNNEVSSNNSNCSNFLDIG